MNSELVQIVLETVRKGQDQMAEQIRALDDLDRTAKAHQSVSKRKSKTELESNLAKLFDDRFKKSLEIHKALAKSLDTMNARLLALEKMVQDIARRDRPRTLEEIFKSDEP